MGRSLRIWLIVLGLAFVSLATLQPSAQASTQNTAGTGAASASLAPPLSPPSSLPPAPRSTDAPTFGFT